MSKQAVTGILRLSKRSRASSEEAFHKILSCITPERYQIKRVSIFETPISAELEYVKVKSKSRQTQSNSDFIVILILSKNKKDIHFKIFSPKWSWPWTKNDFDENVMDSLNNLEVI